MSKSSSKLEQDLPKFLYMIPKHPCGREGYGCSLSVLVRLAVFENI